MTNEEAIEIIEGRNFSCIECIDRSEECCKALDMAIKALTAISELSKSLKAVNRYEMDEKVLIGFNMAVAIFNECFGEIEQNVGMCQQNVGEMSEKQIDGDLISRQSVITMLQKICNSVDDGEGFQLNEWVEYAKDIPSAEKTAKWKLIDAYRLLYDCSNCGQQSINKYPYCPWCGARMKGVDQYAKFML